MSSQQFHNNHYLQGVHMNLVKAALLSVILSSSLAAMDDNDSNLSDINDSTPTQTDYSVTSPSSDK